MEQTRESRFMKYLRRDRLPNIFCAGCGNGIVMNTFFNGMEMAEINIEDVVMVSGIGCSSRIPGYVKCDSLHTTHGRPISFATGLKLANPDRNVVVFSGDGDAAAIGGNHLIHGARRNIDLTVICINNSIYGMDTVSLSSDLTPPDIVEFSPKGSINAGKIDVTATTDGPTLCSVVIGNLTFTFNSFAAEHTKSVLINPGEFTLNISCSDLAGNVATDSALLHSKELNLTIPN